MSEPADPGCPECGKPRAADGTPTCSCARRASDAHRETRTAEAAAAEDFDPVRIRPFVEIDADSAPLDGDTPPAEVEEPQRLSSTSEWDDVSPPVTEEEPVISEAPPEAPFGGAPERRSRSRALLVTRAGAAAAVLMTGAVIGGVFWYESPSRDDSVSGGVRAGLPEGTPSGDAPSTPDPSGTTSSARPSATSTSSPSETATAGQAPTGTGDPSGTTPTATTTGAPAPSTSRGQPPVLRYGDKGPEVVELQSRLRQVGFYDGEADGTYDRDVESAVRGYQLTRVILQDEPGVYGAATRASLESETKEP